MLAVVEDDDEARFAAAVKALREKRGWSQGELARLMVARGMSSYSQMTVSRTEKGDRPIHLGEARVLADVLGSTVDAMIGQWFFLADHAAVTFAGSTYSHALNTAGRLYDQVMAAVGDLDPVRDNVASIEGDRPFEPAEIDQKVGTFVGQIGDIVDYVSRVASVAHTFPKQPGRANGFDQAAP